MSELESREFYDNKMNRMNGGAPGSDGDDVVDKKVAGTSFIVTYLRPVAGACNVNKACQRSIKSEDEKLIFNVFSPYSKKGRCFYMALEHLQIPHKIAVKDQAPVTLE